MDLVVQGRSCTNKNADIPDQLRLFSILIPIDQSNLAFFNNSIGSLLRYNTQSRLSDSERRFELEVVACTSLSNAFSGE